ncbi:MAG: homocysteine S-methyltransferase family protein [Armatimonadetes bacterium]|nr:homocysteine S-methyltransferase family protein [Armatimonadota bacterium]
MARDILKMLAADVVLGDGGYVLELEHRGYIQAGPYTPEVALEHPEALEQLHREFARAGAQVLQACTFYGSGDKLELVGRQHQVEDINRAAVRLARKVAGESLLVAGGLSPTPTFQPGDRRPLELMVRQVQVQADEGVDFIIGETFIWLEEARLALEAIRTTRLPAMITLNIGLGGSRDGHSPEECARRLEDAGADILGSNCSYDPEISLQVASRMAAATGVFAACQPLGYRTGEIPFTELPEFPLGLEERQLTRFAMADFAARARDSGIRFIGGCCGVAPYHLRAMAEALGRTPSAGAKSPDLSRHIIPEIRRKDDAAYWSPVS